MATEAIEATPSLVSPDGNSGGAIIGARPGANISLNPPDWVGDNYRFQGDDWIAATCRLVGLTFLAIFAYFHPGAEHQAANQARFVAILRLKRVLRLPAILFADFNKTPKQIHDLRWPELFQGQIHVWRNYN